MRILVFTILLAFLLPFTINAQSDIQIPKFVRLPADSVKRVELIRDLNAFLKQTDGSNQENDFVLPAEELETFVLLDEFKGVRSSYKYKSNDFYKPILQAVTKLDSNRYQIQLSYVGVANDTVILRASFRLIASYNENSFLFSSPLKENTKNWKVYEVGNTQFVYQSYIDKSNADKYQNLVQQFDVKLNARSGNTILICTENRIEAMRIMGVDYKLNYNGLSSGTFSSLHKVKSITVLGNKNQSFENFDAHDLWHDRLARVVPRKEVNKPVDEGCAYLYAGSWGLSWETILKQFLVDVASDKKADWKFYKENKKNFAREGQNHLMVDYVVNALLVQKIEQEKGFSGVWQLLNCGPFEKGNKKYYTILNEVIGINEGNYNKEVRKLILEEKKRLSL